MVLNVGAVVVVVVFVVIFKVNVYVDSLEKGRMVVRTGEKSKFNIGNGIGIVSPEKRKSFVEVHVEANICMIQPS